MINISSEEGLTLEKSAQDLFIVYIKTNYLVLEMDFTLASIYCWLAFSSN